MNIKYEVVEKNIEVCKELCNKLMAYQRDKATFQKETFDGMSFETRMQTSFNNSLRNFVAIAKSDEKVIGYVFATIDYITENMRTARPSWASPDGEGLFPNNLALPQHIGTFNNLFVEEEYRSYKVGKKLTEMAMEWLRSFEDTKTLFVFVSNGNDEMADFYKKYGFIESHSAFNGFISAFKQNI